MRTVNDCESFTEAEWNVICLFFNKSLATKSRHRKNFIANEPIQKNYNYKNSEISQIEDIIILEKKLY